MTKPAANRTRRNERPLRDLHPQIVPRKASIRNFNSLQRSARPASLIKSHGTRWVCLPPYDDGGSPARWIARSGSGCWRTSCGRSTSLVV